MSHFASTPLDSSNSFSVLPILQLMDHQGRFVASESVVDHQQAFSVYFSDPYGHRLEVTTYDHAATRMALRTLRLRPG